MFDISDFEVGPNGYASIDIKMKSKIDFEAYEDKITPSLCTSLWKIILL